MSLLAQLGRRLRTPIVNAGKWYNRTAEQKPISTGIVTTGLKTSAADLFAQLVVERRDEVDWKRHGVFCIFGFAYLGGFQYYLYNHLFSKWCSTITAIAGHKGSAPVKVFIDQAIHHPFLYFPTFYSLKGMVQGRPLEETIQKYKEEIWENCKALWLIWVPAQLVNFSVVPRHLRIPFVAGVSFAWTVIISCMRGALQTEETAEEQLPVVEHADKTASHVTVTCPVSVAVAAEHSAAAVDAAVQSQGA